MDKLERLLNLAAALLDADRPLTADELRDRIGGYPDGKATFRRAFERDKDDLRAMGLPIAVEPVPGSDPPTDGYRMRRADYSGAEIRLEPDELAALHLATNLVRLDGAESGLIKLGAGGESAADQVGYVPFDDSLAVLIAAAADRKSVTFTYNETVRAVEPWQLSFSRGHWYLAGWDRVREDERLYRVDRIDGDVEPGDDATHEVGSVDDPKDLRGWELGDGEAIRARVQIDAVQAAHARHLLGTVEEQADGSVIADMDVRNPEAFRSFVLSFLDHAEVLDPPELRQGVVDWLESFA
ncbi:MAG: WYL domain-containing protein [Acidimicrobiales bacterium]|nr:MAG: WYL domain-containing protein [Acidimicrobiales bacterium]